MGFELQEISKVEAANELVDHMQSAEAEAHTVLTKAKDDMACYYNRCHTPTPVFAPGDKVYLEANDIATTRPSAKLSHHRLGPYKIDHRVGTNAYCLLLPVRGCGTRSQDDIELR